jgi:hypothetical protein
MPATTTTSFCNRRVRLAAITIPDAEGIPTCERECSKYQFTVDLFTETMSDLFLRKQTEFKYLSVRPGNCDVICILTHFYQRSGHCVH